MRRARAWLLSGPVAALALATPLVADASVSVGAGSSLRLGSSAVDLGSHDLAIAGTLSAQTASLAGARDVAIQPGGTLAGDQASIQLCGSWSNAGTFAPGTSVVRFVDGCGLTNATILGSSSFFDLEIATGTGKSYALESYSTTSVTNSLVLNGEPGGRLQLASTAAGAEAYLALSGSQVVSYLDVLDVHAVGDPIYLPPNSTSLGNTPGWLSWPALVPAVGAFGAAVLAVTLLLAGRRSLRGHAESRAI